jgi:hypothetical protein
MVLQAPGSLGSNLHQPSHGGCWGSPPFAPAFPPAMLTDSLGQLVDLLDARFQSNPDGQLSSKSDKYNQYKLIILVGICGAPGDPSTWRDLSLDALPDFWTKIRGMRRCNLCLGAFVEGYIVDCPKVSPWEYRFLLTTEMLTMIRNLSFSGDNPDKQWQSQMKGMSIWSLAPQNESTLGEAIERHQRMIDYKNTAENHRSGDRADSAKLTKLDPNAPMDRMSLFKWVDHTSILLTIFFGPECPLVKEFKILTELLQDPKYFHNYTPINWAALTWKANLDAQAFFNHKGWDPGPSPRPDEPPWTSHPITNSEQISSPWIIPCSSKPALRQAIPEALPESRPANAKNQTSGQQYAPQPLPKEPQWRPNSTP